MVNRRDEGGQLCIGLLKKKEATQFVWQTLKQDGNTITVVLVACSVEPLWHVSV